MYGDSQLIILADGNSCTIAAASPWKMMCNAIGTRRRRLLRASINLWPRDCTDSSQWLCSNLICETTAVEIFYTIWYYKWDNSNRRYGKYSCDQVERRFLTLPATSIYSTCNYRAPTIWSFDTCTIWQCHVRLKLTPRNICCIILSVYFVGSSHPVISSLLLTVYCTVLAMDSPLNDEFPSFLSFGVLFL